MKYNENLPVLILIGISINIQMAAWRVELG